MGGLAGHTANYVWLDDPSPQFTPDEFRAKLERDTQAGMRNLVKASLRVTTGLVPTGIAAQTLVG